MGMKQTSRYPYTFAYDWVRMAGVVGSRADAAQWFQSVATNEGNRLDLIAKAADQYCEYWEAIDALDKKKEQDFELWSALRARQNVDTTP